MEIIPKPKRKLPSLEKIFLSFSILIFLFSVLLSFYFWKLENLKKKELSQIEEKISALKTPEIEAAEKEVLKFQQKILDFSKLVKDYFLYSKIFSILESKTLKNIYFSKMDCDFENSTLSLSGQSPNFYILGQQLEVLKNEPSFRIQLKETSLNKEGKVDFKIEIVFDKSILK